MRGFCCFFELTKAEPEYQRADSGRLGFVSLRDLERVVPLSVCLGSPASQPPTREGPPNAHLVPVPCGVSTRPLEGTIAPSQSWGGRATGPGCQGDGGGSLAAAGSAPPSWMLYATNHESCSVGNVDAHRKLVKWAGPRADSA